MNPLRLGLFAASLCAFATPAPAQENPASLQTPAQAIAREPQNLIENADFSREAEAWRLPEDAGVTFLTGANALPAALSDARSRVMRVTVAAKPDDAPYSIALRQELQTPFKAGDSLVWRGYGRSPESLKLGVYVEENGAPYDKSLGETLQLSPDWKLYEVKGTSKADYASGRTNLVFHLATGRGSFEFAGLQLINPNAPLVAVARSNASPDKPVSLLQNADFAAGVTTWNGVGERLKAEAIRATVPGSPAPVGAVRLALSPDETQPPYALQFRQTIQTPVARGDAVYFRALMRSPESVRAGVIYELNTAPHTKTISQAIKLSPQWQEFRFVGYAKQSFAPGESQLALNLGYDKGTVELANVRFDNYGVAPRNRFSETVDVFGGAANPDDWRAPALARIEKIRKGEVQLQVVDAAGRPVTNAKVSLEQLRHHFRFGTAVPASRIANADQPNNARMRDEIKRLFNTVVFESDMKWPNMGNPRTLEQIDVALKWLHDNEIGVRGHNLVWGAQRWMPANISVKDTPTEELRRIVRERVAQTAKRYNGNLYVWDVVNEAATNTELWEKLGWDEFARTFKDARATSPNTLLAYNDYNMVNFAPDNGRQFKLVQDRIQKLIDRGAPLDVIGDQAHMGVPLTPIKRVLEILDEEAKYGLPIEITEFDVGLHDDTLHGEYVRDFLIASFSHPKVMSFIQWGFWEGSHWRAEDGAAMFRRDWSKRPAQIAYEDLVLNQWWTRANANTNDKGELKTRAFYGRHRVTVEQGGRKTTRDIDLVPGQSGDFVVQLS